MPGCEPGTAAGSTTPPLPNSWYAAMGVAPRRASSPSPVARWPFLARMRVRARRSASARWGEGARDRVAIGVRFGLREVAGCAGGTREDGGFDAECGDPLVPQQGVP